MIVLFLILLIILITKKILEKFDISNINDSKCYKLKYKNPGRIILNIGSSSTHTKIIKISDTNIFINPQPINKQNPSWRDRFSVKIIGNKLYVKRIDSNSGWGQNLILSGYRFPVGCPSDFKKYQDLCCVNCPNESIFDKKTNECKHFNTTNEYYLHPPNPDRSHLITHTSLA